MATVSTGAVTTKHNLAQCSVPCFNYIFNNYTANVVSYCTQSVLYCTQNNEIKPEINGSFQMISDSKDDERCLW